MQFQSPCSVHRYHYSNYNRYCWHANTWKHFPEAWICILYEFEQCHGNSVDSLCQLQSDKKEMINNQLHYFYVFRLTFAKVSKFSSANGPIWTMGPVCIDCKSLNLIVMDFIDFRKSPKVDYPPKIHEFHWINISLQQIWIILIWKFHNEIIEKI